MRFFHRMIAFLSCGVDSVPVLSAVSWAHGHGYLGSAIRENSFDTISSHASANDINVHHEKLEASERRRHVRFLVKLCLHCDVSNVQTCAGNPICGIVNRLQTRL